MTTITLQITGMSCGHCVNAATEALRAVPGVTDARVTLSPGAAVVTGTATAESLIAALAEENYSAVIQASG